MVLLVFCDILINYIVSNRMHFGTYFCDVMNKTNKNLWELTLTNYPFPLPQKKRVQFEIKIVLCFQCVLKIRYKEQ